MIRFHLHLHNSIGFVPDEEGGEFPDLAAARLRAIESIRSILSDEVLRGALDLRGRIEIVDEAGTPVATVRFAEAVRLQSGAAPA